MASPLLANDLALSKPNCPLLPPRNARKLIGNNEIERLGLGVRIAAIFHAYRDSGMTVRASTS
jgi:hypothetical protein